MKCNAVGDTNSDIAGLGIICAFVVQGGLSVVLSIISVAAEAFQTLPRCEQATARSLEKWIVCINSIISNISYAQIVNGISLLIAALAQRESLSLYHMHIVYDTVNLTGVSACASLANLIRAPKFKLSIGPHTYLFVFSCFYLAFCIILGIRLSHWNYGVAGQCFDTGLVAASGAPHPLTDHVYLSITCFYMFGSVSVCWECGGIQDRSRNEDQEPGRTDNAGSKSQPGVFSIIGQALVQTYHTVSRHKAQLELTNTARLKTFLEKYFTLMPFRREVTIWLISVLVPGNPSLIRLKTTLLFIALCQFPLHTYMIFALRYSNEHRLSGDSENAWGFGQIVALVLLVSTLVQSLGTIINYIHESDPEGLPGVVELEGDDERPQQTP